MTVTDNDGGIDTDEVTVTVNSGLKYINVNIYGGTNPYNNSEWNNWNVTSSLSSGTFNYSDGNSSGVSAALSHNQTVADNGASYGVTMAPAEVYAIQVILPSIVRLPSADLITATLIR